MTTSEETLKQLSESIDAYTSAKMSNNEQLIRFAIANLQQFFNAHVITPVGEAGEGGSAGEGEAGV